MIVYITIALIILFVVYVGLVTIKYGVLHSISRSFYVLRKKKKGGWFRAMMFTSGLFLILIAAYAGSHHSWSLYLSGIGAILTGVHAMYTKQITGIIHYISSGVMLVFALLFVGLVLSWIPMVLISISALVVALLALKEKISQPLFWGEISAFGGTLTSLLIYAINF